MRFNRKLPLALALTFAVLLVLFIVALVMYRRRAEAEEWRTRNYRVLLETSDMRNGLAEAQIGLRGYLLTHDEKLIASVENSQQNFTHSLRVVLDLAGDNYEQTKRVETLERQYSRWKAVARRQIASQQAMASTPRAQISPTENRRLFEQGAIFADEARATLSEIDASERALLANRVAQSEVWRTRMEAVVFGGSVLGLLAMGVLSLLLLSNMRVQVSTGRLLQKENAERQRAENEVRIINDSLSAQIEHIERRNREIELLSSCGQMLQACHTTEEAREVVTQFIPRLFPFVCGTVYLFNASGNFLESASAWGKDGVGTQANPPDYFAPDDCWALRRGQWNQYERGANELACRHLKEPLPASSLCVPMMAQGNVLGMLHLYEPVAATLDDSQRRLALAVADQIGLAIANLQLRETLRHQSIRDPLTNLYNRRYLEEALEHELHRALRDKKSIGVVMMDIDHFKRFNDVYGHAAGDALLQTISTHLLENIRASDIGCRYGGEELTLILPEASRAQTQARTEELRKAIAQIKIRHLGQLLEAVTISAGIAVFPDDAASSVELLKMADAALYVAKSTGRNRVIVHGASVLSDGAGTKPAREVTTLLL